MVYGDSLLPEKHDDEGDDGGQERQMVVGDTFTGYERQMVDGIYYRNETGCWEGLNPVLCCPNEQGNQGFVKCFNEVFTLERCCGSQAFFRENRESLWGDTEDLILDPEFLLEDIPCSAIRFASVFARILNRKFSSPSPPQASTPVPSSSSSSPPKLIVEIGVLRGQFTADLLGKLEFPLHYYGIDPWRVPDPTSVTHAREYTDFGFTNEEHRQNMQLTLDNVAPYWDRVNILQMYSMEALTHFEDESITFLFIDGNHSGESVEEDMRNFWPKIAPGGIMAGHDYEHPEVGPEVNAFSRKIGQRPHVPFLHSAACWYFTKSTNKTRTMVDRV